MFVFSYWADLWYDLMSAPPPMIWLAALLVALGLGLMGELVLRILFRLLRSLARRTRTLSDDHLVSRLRVPARVLLGATALHAAAHLAHLEWPEGALVLIEWLLLTFILVESAETLVVDLLLEERFGFRVPPILRQVSIGIVYLGVALAAVGHISGMDVTPLLATTSVVSIVLGLALQQPLSNLFAGLVLAFDRPFKEGDWILVNNKEGCIENVGWRATRLRTLSGDHLVLSNISLLTSDIQNFALPFRSTARLIELICSVRVPPADLTAWVREEVAKIPGCLTDPLPRVWLRQLEPTFQRYTIKIWIEDFSLHDELESEVLKAMWYRLSAEGVPLSQETPVRLLT